MKFLKLFILSSLLGFSGCDAEDTFTAIKQSIDEDTIWVFAQINIPEDNDEVADYYYYGRIKKDIYDLIIDGQLKNGFILFRDIRYWNNDDEVEKFEDEAYAGDATFRIEHMVKIDLIKGDPFILENTKEVPEM